MKKLTLLKTVSIGLAMVAGNANANLLVDGSFESLNLNIDGFGPLLELFGPGSAVGGSWTNIGGFVLGKATTYTEGPFIFAAQDGTKSIDLTGFGNQGPTALSQTVSLVAGNYVLSFYLGNVNSDPQFGLSLPASVKVLINNQQQGGIFTNSAGSTTTNWEQVLVPFQSLGGSTTITFSTFGLNLDYYTGIDNVVLAAVPEPKGYGLALVSMGLVAFVVRRRLSK